MFARIFSQIMLLNGYMAGTVVLSFLLCTVYLISLRRFRFGRRGTSVYGFFLGLSLKQQLAVSALYLRFLFVLSCSLSMHFDSLVYMVLLIALGLLIAALKSKLRHVVFELLNTALLFTGLYAGGMLCAYLREIQFEWSILMIYILLSTFMALYTFYFMLRDIKIISAERRWQDSDREALEKRFETGAYTEELR